MNNQLRLTKFFSTDKSDLFEYWVMPELLEKWSAPKGMTLEVPLFEAKLNGNYRYEHSSDKGLYVCTGYIKEFIPEERLVMMDTVVGPDGKIMLERLESIIEFNSSRGGTEVVITQNGFPNEEARMECESGWRDCLDQLSSLIEKNYQPRFGQQNLGNNNQVSF